MEKAKRIKIRGKMESVTIYQDYAGRWNAVDTLTGDLFASSATRRRLGFKLIELKNPPGFIISSNEAGYYHNRNGWVFDPVEATIYKTKAGALRTISNNEKKGIWVPNTTTIIKS